MHLLNFAEFHPVIYCKMFPWCIFLCDEYYNKEPFENSFLFVSPSFPSFLTMFFDQCILETFFFQWWLYSYTKAFAKAKPYKTAFFSSLIGPQSSQLFPCHIQGSTDSQSCKDRILKKSRPSFLISWQINSWHNLVSRSQLLQLPKSFLKNLLANLELISNSRNLELFSSCLLYTSPSPRDQA